MLARWQRDELIELVDGTDILSHTLADYLAGCVGGPIDAAALANWLLDQPDIEDVFGDDDTLGSTLEEEARQVKVDEPAADGVAEQRASHAARAEYRRVNALLKRACRDFLRVAFAPKLGAPRTTVPQRKADSASQYLGVPLLTAGETWPYCELCEEPMTLLVQVDLKQLPRQLKYKHKRGLVQLFYCTNKEAECEEEGEAWMPGAPSTLARWIERPSHKDQPEPPTTPAPAIPIESWEAQPPELPAKGEGAELRQELDTREINWEALVTRKLVARPDDKLGGWPTWQRHPHYPRCPECREPMQLLLQMASGGHCSHRFGGAEAGQLFQCASHIDYVGFSWSSTA